MLNKEQINIHVTSRFVSDTAVANKNIHFPCNSVSFWRGEYGELLIMPASGIWDLIRRLKGHYMDRYDEAELAISNGGHS